MPEHVHRLVYLTITPVRIDALLSAIKRPHSGRIKHILAGCRSPLLSRLMMQERPGTMVFRYWQEGPGDDRNLSKEATVLAAINDLPENPVRRGLVRGRHRWEVVVRPVVRVGTTTCRSGPADDSRPAWGLLHRQQMCRGRTGPGIGISTDASLQITGGPKLPPLAPKRLSDRPGPLEMFDHGARHVVAPRD